MPINPLLDLATAISGCRICDKEGIALDHAPPLRRGEGGDFMVVGVAPGKTEVANAEAFVGPAGKRLMMWLTEAGVGDSREAILARCYLTSVIKCRLHDDRNFHSAARNCLPFFTQQVALVRPKVCITLGLLPLKVLMGFDGDLSNAVGTVRRAGDISLSPVLPPETLIVPFPHPSPVSRWLNNSENLKRLTAAKDALRGLAS